MTMPNFLIVGAAKAGTTSLYAYLKQHPQVYMSPVKETNFFAFEGEKLNFLGSIDRSYLADFKTNINDYLAQFQGVTDEIAIGEVSPSYLYIPQAVDRIKHYVPDIKIIVVLRNPVDRAYSHFLHHIRDRLVHDSDFFKAINAESQRIAENWWWDYHYFHVGMYYQQLKRYFDNFNREKIKIYFYEDFKDNSLSLIQDIFQFIDVDREFQPDISARYNATGIPQNRTLDALIYESNPIKTVYQLLPARLRRPITAEISKLNHVKKPSLSSEIRKNLIELYREDIIKLQKLIEKDLSHWMN